MDRHVVALRKRDVPDSRFDPDDLFGQVRRFCAEVRDRHVRELLLGLLDDPELGLAFRVAPAAKTIHHAWAGGLCEHTLSILQLAWRVCDHYPQPDRDLVTAGCLLPAFGAIFSRDPAAGPFTEYQRLYDRHLFKLPSWNGEPRAPDARRFRGPGLYETGEG